VIQCFEECPEETRQQHPIALLIYALTLMTYNEMELFEKVCLQFSGLLEKSDLDAADMNRLMGEFELLLSFTRYNDITGMAEHIKKSCELLKEPSAFMDTRGNWTFGSPSVLYMFYRESGKLSNEISDIKEAMPYYYCLTHGHGMGAEYLMEAEWFLNQCDYENAEILAHKAISLAKNALQPNMVLCGQFIQARLALGRGNYNSLLTYFREMRENIEQQKAYELIHTVDMCSGFIYACLQQSNKVPEWLAAGNFNSSRLLFPSLAFSNIIHGRVLLLLGDYTKLLGIAEQFVSIAGVIPYLLAKLYTTIYIAAANERIFRRSEALEAMKQALELAIPDKMYLPFIENCDYINPLLETLYGQGIHCKEIARILEQSAPYQGTIKQIQKDYLQESKPKLTVRETEIARLAAEGYSNKGIGERLYITENTVKTQLKNVFDKLGINSRSLLKQTMESLERI
jgi:LuxR family maltose regulon positive regulatory protein